jgi:hypothetical protein
MPDMSAERAEALEVLREVWRSQGQTAADLDDGSEQKTCRRMADAGVGFDEFAAGAGQEDRSAAWRARLEREGKLGDTSLRDIVLGPNR